MLALPLDDSYDDPQALFKAILEFVDGDDAFSMSHDELEDELQEQGRELMRRRCKDTWTGARSRSRGYRWWTPMVSNGRGSSRATTGP